MEATAADPPETVLVLHGGRVLRGRIAREGDWYAVQFGEQGQTRLPTSSVDFHCGSLEEAYRVKRARITSTDAKQNIELAHWCLRNKMWARASDQLLVASSIDPNARELPSLYARLWEVERRDAAHSTVKSDASTPSPEELDQIVRNLPRGAVEQFTGSVQPVLLNNCSTSSCHHLSSPSEFRLIRPSPNRPMMRRFTQRNLYATLKMLDQRSPLESPLLEHASVAHASLEAPVFSESDKHQYDRLAQWVKLVTGHDKPPPTSVLPPRSDVLLRPEAIGDEVEDASTAQRRTAVFVPRDAFDPEIFNRRYVDLPPESESTGGSSNSPPASAAKN